MLQVKSSKQLYQKTKQLGEGVVQKPKWPGWVYGKQLWERQKGSREGVRKSTVERRDERGQVSFL